MSLDVIIIVERHVQASHLKIFSKVDDTSLSLLNGKPDTNKQMPLLQDANGKNAKCWEWEATVDLETGQVMNWPQGTTAQIGYQATNSKTYFALIDTDGEEILDTPLNYVPICLDTNNRADCSDSNFSFIINEKGFIEGFTSDVDDIVDYYNSRF